MKELDINRSRKRYGCYDYELNSIILFIHDNMYNNFQVHRYVCVVYNIRQLATISMRSPAVRTEINNDGMCLGYEYDR